MPFNILYCSRSLFIGFDFSQFPFHCSVSRLLVFVCVYVSVLSPLRQDKRMLLQQASNRWQPKIRTHTHTGMNDMIEMEIEINKRKVSYVCFTPFIGCIHRNTNKFRIMCVRYQRNRRQCRGIVVPEAESNGR